MGFPGGSVIKNLPANAGAQETQVWFLSWDDPTLEEEMAIHSSILDGIISWTEEQSMGSQRVKHEWSDWAQLTHTYIWYRACPGGSVVKNLPADAGDAGSLPGSGRSPGGGNSSPLQYPCLENPMDRGAWWATVHGVAKSQTQLSMSPSLLIEMLLERNPLNKNKSHKEYDVCQRTSLS